MQNWLLYNAGTHDVATNAAPHLLLQLSIVQQATSLITIQKCNYDQVCKFYE